MSSISPTQSATQVPSTSALVEITVHSVMDGVRDERINIAVDATVFELKRCIAIATSVLPEQQFLLYNETELSDDAATLGEYGINSPCVITMNVRMHTGLLVDRCASDNLMTFLPVFLPVPRGNFTHLRNTIRTMTNVRDRPRPQKTPQPGASTTTAVSRQLENEKTRKRIKNLMEKRKRKQLHILSSPPTAGHCSPALSTRDGKASASPSEASAAEQKNKSNDRDVTQRELRGFFEPPESENEVSQNREQLHLAPENEDQLNKVKREREQLDRTTCKICRHKLKLSEQEIHCLCQFVFCQQHRDPSAHFCHIDHKQAARTKLKMENQKVVYDSHKANAQF
ncbi:hypothetical protein Q1695_016404 [Nippostrongylus brasiliensis]|nr:hypothetical protein Q1695_016404 [Nippostrongylus brasiliensis]